MGTLRHTDGLVNLLGLHLFLERSRISGSPSRSAQLPNERSEEARSANCVAAQVGSSLSLALQAVPGLPHGWMAEARSRACHARKAQMFSQEISAKTTLSVSS